MSVAGFMFMSWADQLRGLIGRVIVANLIVAQLSKNFPSFYWYLNVHYRVQNNPLLLRILSHVKLSTYLPKANFSITLVLGIPVGPVSLGF